MRSSDSLIEIAWRHRRAIGVFTAVCLLGGLLFLWIATPQYTASAQLLVQRHTPGIIGNTAPITSDDQGTFLYTQRQIIRSTPVIAIALASTGDLRTFHDQRNRFKFFRDHLNVEVGKKDGLLTIDFPSPYPEEAVKIVNAVVKGYTEFQTKQRHNSASEALGVLTSQLTKTQAELDQVNKKQQEYRSEHSLLSADSGQRDVTAEGLKTLKDSLNAARLEQLNAQAEYDEITRTILKDPQQKKEVERMLASGTSVATGSDVQLVRTDLFQWQARLQDLKRQYGSRHPSVILAEGRVKQLTISYAAAVERWYQLASQKLSHLQSLWAEQHKLAVKDDNKEFAYNQLAKKAASLQKQIDMLNNQVGHVNLADDGGVPTITVVEPTRAGDKPSYPSKSKTLALAMLIGLLGGFGFALIRDRNDSPLVSARQIRQTLGTRVIGLVPRMAVSGRVLENDPASEVAEGCRALYLTVADNVPKMHCKAILVTSPSRGDGKSTVAANLAAAMAREGKHVLLVDADLRSPSLQRVFDLRGRAGLGNMLYARELAEGAIHDSGVEGLDILPAGDVVGNPIDLLNSERFNAVLDHLIDVYDHVVIDSPPAVVADDARIVAASCDLTLLVLRAGRANRRLSELAREGLSAVGANIVGVVVNDVQPQNYAQYDGAYEDGAGLRRAARTATTHRANDPDLEFEEQLRSMLVRRRGLPERMEEHKPLYIWSNDSNGGIMEGDEE